MTTRVVKNKNAVAKFGHFELVWVAMQVFTRSKFVVEKVIRPSKIGSIHVSNIMALTLFYKKAVQNLIILNKNSSSFAKS